MSAVRSQPSELKFGRYLVQKAQSMSLITLAIIILHRPALGICYIWSFRLPPNARFCGLPHRSTGIMLVH
jgi:hypothetical protein